MFSASGLSAFAMLTLAFLNLGTVLIKMLEKDLRVAEKRLKILLLIHSI